MGVFAALLCRKQGFDRVILIEKSTEFGGLLGSFQGAQGAWYDYGTHIPGLSGDVEIDGILYGTPAEREQFLWTFPYLKSENYFGGNWFKTSPLVSLHSLGPGLYQKALVELLEAREDASQIFNLEEYCNKQFGSTITENLYRPIIKKLLGAELSGLNREVLRTFGLQRVIALDSELTQLLKQVPRLDAKLGYHSYTDGTPSTPYIYPKEPGGIGRWMNGLLDRLKSEGVELIGGESVSKIHHHAGRAESIELMRLGKIDIDWLFWTVPVPLALKAAGIPFQSKLPKFRTTSLFHFAFDRPLLKQEPQYLLCWDPGFQSYRITLYPNIRPERSEHSHLTVEVLSAPMQQTELPALSQKIFQELKELQVIHPASQAVEEIPQLVGETFPLTSPDFIEQAVGLTSLLEGSLKNVMALGRSAGSAFFINDLLIQSYRRMMGMRK